MKKIHNSLLGKSQHYANWHQHPHHKKVHWGAFLVVGVVLAFIILGSIAKWKDSVYNVVMIQFASRSAVLTLDPQIKSVKVGEAFTVNILLDTDGKPVDGVDVYSLHYDPTIVAVVDDMPKKTGVQITSGTLMDFDAVNSVDAKTGTIKFSQASQAGTTYNGKGVLATIHMKAVGKGNTYLKFDFALGSTRDTNVAHKGHDQLLNVVDGVYTVTAK